VLPDKTVFLAEKFNNILQLQTTSTLKMKHI